MFLIYINYICEAVSDAKVKLYADDTQLFLLDTDANNLNIKANTSLKELNTWFEINRLSLNIEKTCDMVFSPPSIWLHLFCVAGHEKRRGEQLKWSLAFRL